MIGYKYITKYKKFSEDKITNLKEKIYNNCLTNNDIFVVAAGSYARKEAGECSDLDFMVFGDDKDTATSVDSEIRKIAQELKIHLPNSNGVFHPLNPEDLIHNIGKKEEKFDELAQRLLLLMEPLPLYNEEKFVAYQKDILNMYFNEEYYLNKFPVFLLNDTIRYFRTICVNYQYSFTSDKSKWCLRNIKLRHSRITMYGGLLFLILNSSKKDNKNEYIMQNINKTPLEKIIEVCKDNDYVCDPILSLYDTFLKNINNEKIRDSLLNVDYNNRYACEAYKLLKDNSDSLMSAFSDFIFFCYKNEKWEKYVFEYLLF